MNRKDLPDTGRTRGRRTPRPFTLVEILIVLVVAGLVLAVVAPKMLEKSDQMTVEQVLNDLRTAVNETAMRSRATGQALSLTLTPDAQSLSVSPEARTLDRSWQPPLPSVDDGAEERRQSFIDAKPSYGIRGEVEWNPSDEDLNDEGNFVISFFPDGQAAARELPFTVCGRRFLLTVDRITAAPTILELTD